MEPKTTLARRIVIAFLALSVLVGGSFAGGIYYAIHFVEGRLISEELDRELDRIVSDPNYLSRIELDEDMQFFAQPADRPQAVPDWVLPIEPGFHEVFHASASYHAWVKDKDGIRYYLLSDQSDFERHEQLLFYVILAGFIISLFIAWLLGRGIVHIAIEPVVRLSRQVGDRGRLLEAPETLARHFPNDEVGQLAASFDDLLIRFRQALDREKLFSADVSHELRTPLMVVASSCELLLEDSRLPPESRQKIRAIADAAEGMRQLVHTLLMLLRSEQNKYEQVPRNPLRQIVRNIEREWRPRVEAQGLQFDVEAPASNDNPLLPDIFIQIILNNLLHNALHHTHTGKISLTASADTLVVQDTGVGIPANERQQVFEPFTQGQGSRQQTQGMGLGLSLAQRICQSQGWVLHLQSAQNGGSRFTLKFADAVT